MPTTSLTVGDPAPWFLSATAISNGSPPLTVGGYPAVLCFFGSSSDSQVNQVVKEFCALQEQLQQCGVHFFGVSIDPDDKYLETRIQAATHFRFLWDFDGDLSIRYGVCRDNGSTGIIYDPATFVLDENLRIQAIVPLNAAVSHVGQVMNFIKQLPVPDLPQLVTRQAPVLVIPNVLDRPFCDTLIDLYAADGGKESGFMQQVGDKTLEVLNTNVKQRRDFVIRDHDLIGRINQYIWRRVKPEIEKAFQFSITRYERYLVACYDADNQGFFSVHRDNATRGTMHRRFAMTLNLNTGAYEGGYLRFPEYGSQLYRPGIGEAVIFSCSLLHEATPVTSGQRFTLLSFFHNDDDAKVREQNVEHVVLKENQNQLAVR